MEGCRYYDQLGRLRVSDVPDLAFARLSSETAD